MEDERDSLFKPLGLDDVRKLVDRWHLKGVFAGQALNALIKESVKHGPLFKRAEHKRDLAEEAMKYAEALIAHFDE